MARHVHVITRRMDDDGPGDHMVIDHDDAFQRRWLGKHAQWAICNNRSVMTYPTNEAVTFVKKVKR